MYKDSRLATSYTVINPLKGMDILSQVDHNFDVFTEDEQIANKVYHTYYHQRFEINFLNDTFFLFFMQYIKEILLSENKYC